MEKSNLITQLEKLYPLSADFKEALLKHVKQTQLKKGQPLRIPSNQGNIWYVASGMMKACYFNQSGKEFITRFWQQGEIAVFKKYPLDTIPAPEFLMMLESTQLIYLSDAYAAHLLKHFPECYPLVHRISRADAFQSEILNHLLVLPLAQAYQKFSELFPAHRISVKDAASYLGVAPSRISELRSIR